MIRKLLLVAAATAVPMGAVATGIVGTGVAGAKPALTAPPITCAASGTVTFTPPGISHLGSITPNKKSATTTTATTLNGCSGGPNTSGGSLPPETILSKNTKCPKVGHAPAPGTNPPPGCFKPNLYDDSASGFASTGTAVLQKALHKLLFTLDGIAFKGKTLSASQITPGGACGATETGFALSGSVKTSPKYSYSTFSFNACLGTDTGSNLASGGTNFYTDIVDALGGGPDVIATTQIDPATSTLHIS